MEKPGTIIAYVLMFLIVTAIFLIIPKDFLKKSDSKRIIREKPEKISFSQVSNFYEAREREQNRRVITVYVRQFVDAQEVWMQIFDYANKLPLTTGGFTAVFFFDNPAFTPHVDYFTEEFEDMYKLHCIAGYWKYSNGTDIFRQYPFKRPSLS